MNRIISLLIAVIACLGTAAHGSTPVYKLKIDDEIGSTTWRYTRQALNQARSMGSPLLLVHLNTYGGSVVHADSIRTALLHYDGPVVAFVDNNAASAGALIALACDSVYMRPDASMGAATVVNGSDGAAMPDKYQSYMRAMMRATAESHGVDSAGIRRRNPAIAEAMVDSRIEVPGLIDSTKVLTFTPDEAIQWGYAEGKAETTDDVLRQLGITDYRMTSFEPSWEDKLLGFLTNPAFQAVLIMVMIGGIYFELQTPGMGFPSAAALIAAVLYFLPLCIGGIISTWVVILFVIGLILLLLEIFVVPGFGITGIGGIAAMTVAVFMGLLENFAPDSSESFRFIDMHSVAYSILTLLAGAALAVGAIALLTSRFGPKFIRRGSELSHSQEIDKGYIGVDMSALRHVGTTAVTVTDLHPSGKIRIDGEGTFDAVAEHGFIDADTQVRVTRFSGAQLYVEQI
ncbi:MAG: nodulation protein NfeD [Muribaculaceae bacterium]|nr:nodulation protein NfeD [Muribaculaceae bacterium]